MGQCHLWILHPSLLLVIHGGHVDISPCCLLKVDHFARLNSGSLICMAIHFVQMALVNQ